MSQTTGKTRGPALIGGAGVCLEDEKSRGDGDLERLAAGGRADPGRDGVAGPFVGLFYTNNRIDAFRGTGRGRGKLHWQLNKCHSNYRLTGRSL